jgi:hypothetical protein
VTRFIALYQGRTVADATLVALSAEPEMVRRFFEELAGEDAEGRDDRTVSSGSEREPLHVVPGGEG